MCEENDLLFTLDTIYFFAYLRYPLQLVSRRLLRIFLTENRTNKACTWMLLLPKTF